jgi:hypothetical protein
MADPSGHIDEPPGTPGLFTLLPGPDRKRSATNYVYTLTYRNPEPLASGCVMTWEVRGGRLTYQIAIERDPAGQVQFHCTCADAVFRAAPEGHCCKHLRGFIEIAQQLRQQAEGLSLRRGA